MCGSQITQRIRVVATAQFAPMIVRTLSLSLLLGAAEYAPHAAARAR